MIFNRDNWISALEVFDQNIFGILKLNLTTDSYEVIKNRKQYDDCKSLSEMLKSFSERGIIHPQDTRAYNDHVDLGYLRNYFTKEDAIWRLRCRCKKGEGFSWIMMEMHPSRNFSQENMELYMFLQDVDNEIFDRHVQQVMMRQRIVEERLMMQMANEVLDSGNWHVFYNESGEVEQVIYDEKFSSLYGYKEPKEMIEEAGNWVSLIHPEDRPEVECKIEEILKNNRQAEKREMFKKEFRAMTKQEGYRWFLALGEVHAREDGKPYLFFGIMIDITAKREYDQALQKEIEAKERLQDALRHEKEEREIIDSIASIYNSIHVIDLENQTYDEIRATGMIHSFYEEHKSGLGMQELFNSIMKLAARGEFMEMVLDFVNLSTLPSRLYGRSSIALEFIGVISGWLQARFIPVKCRKDGTPAVVLFTTLSIDEQKRREEHLIRISNTDELTRLYNRRAYENDVTARMQKGTSQDFVLISIDVTGLKRINDSLGHAAGDELLQGTAQCLLVSFGTNALVYRTGGDEFMVMLEASREELQEKLLALETSTARYKGRYVEGIILARGVVCQYEFPQESILELEKIADQRMYRDKSIYYETHGIEKRH